MLIQLSSFTLTLKLPVFKEEVLAFLESDKQGQVKLNPTCVLKRKAREVGDYYREPCPVVLCILSAYGSAEVILCDEDLTAMKKLLMP